MNGCIGPKYKGRLSFQHFPATCLLNLNKAQERLTFEDSSFDG